MNGRELRAALLALLLVLVFGFAAGFLGTGAAHRVYENPTDAPSGERPEPCDLEHERACNELVDVEGGRP